MLAQAYRQARERLDELVQALPEGELTTRELLFAQQRLRLLGAQLDAALDDLIQRGAQITADGQREFVALAQEHAEALAKAGATLDITWAQLPAQAVEQLLGQLQPGSPLHDLLAELGDELHRMVERELVAGLALGGNPRDVALRMVDNLRLAYVRAERIARTELLRAYRETTRQSYMANANVVHGWIWYSALDVRTCPACWAMHGTRHTLDEVLDDHPNGRCAMVPVTDWSRPVPLGDVIFADLPQDKQRAILGQAAWEAYRDGRVALRDFVGRRSHSRWGTMRYAKSLRSVLGV